MVNTELYPIGTIIELVNQKLLILGYQQRIVDDNFVNCYCVVPYPLGFTNYENVVLVEVDSVEKMIFKGYENDKIYHEFIEREKSLFDITKEASVKEVEKVIDLVADTLEDWKNG